MTPKFTLSIRQKICLAISLISFTILLTGCTTSWITEANSLITQIMPAVSAILGLLGALAPGLLGSGVLAKVQAAATEVSTAFTNVVVPLLAQYQAAEASAQPGILGEIQAALQTIQGNWQTVLTSIHITDPATQAKVEAVAGVVGELISSLVALIPALQAAQKRGDTDMTALLADVRAKGGDLPLTAGQFKKQFNAAMKQKTGKPDLDALTAKFTIK